MAFSITPADIRVILQEYSSKLPLGIENKVHRYVELLSSWNRKIALTAVTDPEEIVRFHFGESIFAVSFLENANGRLADVGTGAGFPGLAFKLACPGLSLVLIEPNRKKCAFLHEIVRSLDLPDVQIASVGFRESFFPENSLSYVTSRALAMHLEVLNWAKEKLDPRGGVLFWVGGNECKTVAETQGWRWSDPVLIPRTRERFVLRGFPL